MSIDLDPTEERLAAALTRLAAANVPDVGHAPQRRTDNRRWLALAVAASLVALIAGIVAVAGRDTSRPVITTPTSTPPATPTTAPAPTTSADTTPPEAAIEVPDDPVAIIDPAIAPSEPTTTGQIDPFLSHTDEYELQTLRAVRRAPDGSIAAAVSVGLVPDVAGLTGDVTIAGRPTLRSVLEMFGQVALRIDLDGGTLEVITSLDAESEVTGWLEQLLADPATGEPDVAALAPPEGFEALPPPLTINHVTYADDAGSVTIDTTRFTAPVEAATWASAQSFGADITTADAITTVVMEGGASYLLWQPSPDVLVTLPGDGDRGRWPGDLLLASMEAAQAVPVVNDFGGGDDRLDERSLDRIVLDETSIGRFAYIEGPEDGRACWSWRGPAGGGTSSCSANGARLRTCTYITIGDTGTAIALVVDRTDAQIEFGVGGAPAEGTVERGVATDGTPWLFAWVEGAPATEAGSIPATITVDGEPCEFG